MKPLQNYLPEYYAAAISSALVIIIYNVFLVNLLSPVYNLTYDTLNEKDSSSLLKHPIAFFITFLFIFIGIAQTFIYLVVINRFSFLRWLGVFCLCLSGALMAYAINEFNVEINTSNLFNLFNSNYSETSQFFSNTFYYYVAFGTILATLIAFILKRYKKSNLPLECWLFSFLFLVSSFSASLSINGTFTAIVMISLFLLGAGLQKKYQLKAKAIALFTFFGLFMLAFFLLNKALLPLNLVHELIIFQHKRAELQKLINAPKENIAEKYKSTFQEPTEPLTVILIVGESARSDNFGINGYERDTTPRLAERTNLISFRRAFSCGIVTRTSIPCMFTRAEKAENAIGYPETTLISFFNAHEFHTEWIDMHPFANFFHAPVSPLAMEAEQQLFLNKDITNKLTSEEQKKTSNDTVILDIFKEKAKHRMGNELYVLVTLGSHWQYALRYPATFSKFTPECKAHAPVKCSQESLINSYDNSILFADYVIDSIISTVEDKNALVIYTSDHGQSLGENDKYIHNHPDEINNYHVPFIVWHSTRFAENYPEKVAAITSQQDKIVTHQHYFHSILDCTGFKSSAINSKLSLCNSNFNEGDHPLGK